MSSFDLVSRFLTCLKSSSEDHPVLPMNIINYIQDIQNLLNILSKIWLVGSSVDLSPTLFWIWYLNIYVLHNFYTFTN